MELSSLPIDVFRLIFNGPNSVLAIQLWKSGDRRLAHQLANGGVTEMDLRHRLAKIAHSRWPKMLKYLKLSSLSIEANLSDSIETLRKELCSLHRGLRELAIHNPIGPLGTFCLALFQRLEGPHEAIPPAVIESNGAQTLNLSSNYLRLCNVFPELTVLSVTSNAGLIELSPEHLQLLPRQLTSLKLFAVLPMQCSGLPPRLTSLELSSDREVYLDSIISGFPSTLQHIDIQPSKASFCYLLSDDGIKRFPTLQLRFCPRICFMASQIDKLPSYAMWNRVQTLEMPQYTTPPPLGNGFVLPSSLTSLCLPELDDFNIAVHPLPKMLTHLEVGELNWEPIKSNHFLFPISLRSFATQKAPAGVRHFYLLPRKLEHLEWRKFDALGATLNQPDSLFLDFIVQFTKATDGKILDAMHEESIQHPSLTYSSDNIRAIQHGYHFGLPLTLKSLDLQILYGVTPLTMPPHLTTAILGKGSAPYPRYLLQSLPPSLTKLQIFPSSQEGYQPFCTESKTIVHPSTAHPSTRAHGTTHPSTGSSPSSALALQHSTSQQSPSGLVELLPRGLKHLISQSVEVQTWYTMRGLALLPQGLVSLHLFSTSGIAYTPGWVEILPKTITELSVELWIFGEDLHLLPPSLVDLTGRLKEVTSLHILALPMTMRRLRTRGSKAASAPDHLEMLSSLELLLYVRHYLPTDTAISAEAAQEIIKTRLYLK